MKTPVTIHLRRHAIDLVINDGDDDSNLLSRNIEITAVNDAPVAADDPFDTDEDVVLTGSVLGNDTDIDGDTMSVNTAPFIDPVNGSVQLLSLIHI